MHRRCLYSYRIKWNAYNYWKIAIKGCKYKNSEIRYWIVKIDSWVWSGRSTIFKVKSDGNEKYFAR